MEFFQLSETTRAHEIDAELKKSKWRNEWLDPTSARVAPGPLLDIFFLFFSKTKIFHSHPCGCEFPSVFFSLLERERGEERERGREREVPETYLDVNFPLFSFHY